MILDVLFRPMADAFLQVGVFVALFAGIAAIVRMRWGRTVDGALLRNAAWAPVIAAALGVMPGCSGAILVATFYARGTASFGALTAALTANMGDSSWVMIAANPRLALLVHAILFVTGTLTGYAVDRTRLAPVRSQPAATKPAGGSRLRPPTRTALAARLGSVIPAYGLVVPFWGVVALGGVVSLPMAVRPATADDITRLFSGIDATLVLGVVGCLIAMIVFVMRGCRMADDDVATATTTDLPGALRHGAEETAFVTVWVFAAFVAQSLLTNVGGVDLAALPLAGLTGVLIGALIGFIPGCGFQIAFTGLYVAGVMPFSTLITNAVSQDGDALLPLLALDRRAALRITLITTVPALTVGCATLLVLGA